MIIALHDEIDIADGKHLVVIHGGTWRRASDIQATTSYLVVPDSHGVDPRADTIQELTHGHAVCAINWTDFEAALSQQLCSCCLTYRPWATTQPERKRMRAGEDFSTEVAFHTTGCRIHIYRFTVLAILAPPLQRGGLESD
jgi:hypothetical protein